MAQVDTTVLRILDANLNRAREALRVMEDYARLGLNDKVLTTAIKASRHALAETVHQFESRLLGASEDGAGVHGSAPMNASRSTLGPLIASRDIVADVGCDDVTGREVFCDGDCNAA